MKKLPLVILLVVAGLLLFIAYSTFETDTPTFQTEPVALIDAVRLEQPKNLAVLQHDDSEKVEQMLSDSDSRMTQMFFDLQSIDEILSRLADMTVDSISFDGRNQFGNRAVVASNENYVQGSNGLFVTVVDAGKIVVDEEEQSLVLRFEVKCTDGSDDSALKLLSCKDAADVSMQIAQTVEIFDLGNLQSVVVDKIESNKRELEEARQRARETSTRASQVSH